MILVDVVNFNADGSCIDSETWLRALSGGESSALCRWLSVYVALNRRVSLGFVGATVADIACYNPEALALVRAHHQLFEVILRPFSHDLALLRSREGFRLNVALGREAIVRAFGTVTDVYLPPEFMLTGAGVCDLASQGVSGVFIHADRFGPEIRNRIPREPYVVSGVLGSHLACWPVYGPLTQAYLDSVHAFDGRAWSLALPLDRQGPIVSWRDGETFLLLPDGDQREAAWLAAEPAGLLRASVAEVFREQVFTPPGNLADALLRGYPVHPFAAWFRESRMFGFLSQLDKVEQRLASLTLEERALWLQAINSDVLSAVEKPSPVARVRARPEDASDYLLTLQRSERGLEGEDFLALLLSWRDDPASRAYVRKGPAAHLRKLRARLACLASEEWV